MQKKQEARDHFQASISMYAQMYISFTRCDHPNPFTWSANAIFFFLLAAQNNYSIISLQHLDQTDQCKAVQEGLHTLIEVGWRSLPSNVRGMVEEMFLNATMLSTTDCFTRLPASAA